MISAWQSLTVSPLRLSSSPLTHRFPDREKQMRWTNWMSKFTTMQHLLVLQWPSSVLAFWRCHASDYRNPSNVLASWKKCSEKLICTLQHPYTLSYQQLPLLVCLGNVYTSSQADNSAQAFSPPHDDGGQNLASQKAVLDTCGQGVETLVTQHRYLVMQSAATHWKLEKGMYTEQDRQNKKEMRIIKSSVGLKCIWPVINLKN